ncbi:uncharacterized protein A4U43_C07F34460 [Asparagus officinalis]|uniref:Fungal lipase-type domain-containing protein n=1 Tax=Asparagus officinalis TaxID=4686 RepID=A0A5P1EGZ5_ASPOF|nr:phospholipase A1-Igamma1, chloroplastic [Asparagus officinalis]ONK65175.1 uncharacterized protein A4U43_C07F34460 [Asparagus officinalis]
MLKTKTNTVMVFKDTPPTFLFPTYISNTSSSLNKLSQAYLQPTIYKLPSKNKTLATSLPTMSVSSISTIHRIPLPTTNNTLLSGHRTTKATTTEPPSLAGKRPSLTINRPSTLTNLLHLSTDKHNNNIHINTLPTPTPTTKITTPTLSPREDISSLYPQIHGDADWSSLLDPLHPWLRREILKYGEFSQATYDSFDFDPFSEYCGSCLYNKHNLFKKLNLAHNRYNVTKHVYAMSHIELPRWLERSIHADTWSKDSNWMGYVAVSNDEESRRIGCRDIAIAWRGTIAPAEWFEDLQGRLEAIGDGHGDVRVEHGFLSIYTSKSEASRYNKTSASEQVMEEVKNLVKFYREKGEKVSLTVTGHSLGGALALLNAYEAASSIPELPVTVISFGAPRVGNVAFSDRLKDLKVKTLRVVVKQDMVPKLPGILFNEGLKKLHLEWVYTHVGLELGLDVKSSPYLRRGLHLAGFHNLETYLHLVDGFLSRDSEFRKTAKRDVALVNKASGMLKEELGIPACWNQSANKGLVCNAYGRWVQPQREPEDIPSPLRHEPRTLQSI